MRVGLIAYLLHQGSDYRSAGVSTYCRQLLAHLPRVQPAHDYLAFVGPDSPAVAGVQAARAALPTVNPGVRIAWEQLALPVQLRRRKIDVLHGLVNVLPLAVRGPKIVTVHDLAFLRHPERFSRSKAAYLRIAVGRSVQSAAHVIAVSESTKRDLLELLDVPERKVTVIYPGVSESFKPRHRHRTEQPSTSDDAELPRDRPYLLHVGTLEPRKNIDVLIRAYKTVLERGFPHALVLVGARGWMYESLFDLVARLGLQQDVKFMDFVAPEALPGMYNGADLFAYPSVYEGFGLPVAEAMASGIPTITSSSSSMVEVVGDAALTVAPGSVEELAMAIIRLLEDGRLRDQLRTSGIERAKLFEWSRAASETARLYELAA